MHNYVGCIYTSFFRYFDQKTKTVKIKSRPVLIVAGPSVMFDQEIYALPVSTMLNPRFLCLDFDVAIEPSLFPKLSLNKKCYIRSHKRTIIYFNDIDFNNCIGNLKVDYPSVYKEIIDKMGVYDERISTEAFL